MTKKDWFGIFYVSIAIILWGSVGSLIDLTLLNNNIYSPGSLGQLLTFTLSGLFTSIIAILLFKKLFK